jgi:F420-dependent oxidoreductase-like protein
MVAQIGLMIEGQNGLNWDRWKAVLQTAEQLGFAFVFRSDHFVNPQLPDLDSLELWTSLTYAASETRSIEFGSMVAPVTFRHPAMTARVAAAVDDLSGGRLVLGLGAGWNEREHHVFGIPFFTTRERHERLQEYLQVVTQLLKEDQPSSFEGRFYSLDEAILLPRPKRPGGPRILVGGNGRKRTLPLAARYADEWNAVFPSPAELRELEGVLDELLEQNGRAPADVARSVMVGTRYAADEASLRERLNGRSVHEANEGGLIVGTPEMWVDQIGALVDAGAQRVMLQWLDLDNLEPLDAIAATVLPALRDR